MRCWLLEYRKQVSFGLVPYGLHTTCFYFYDFRTISVMATSSTQPHCAAPLLIPKLSATGSFMRGVPLPRWAGS
jgi:hypothetical protein